MIILPHLHNIYIDRKRQTRGENTEELIHTRIYHTFRVKCSCRVLGKTAYGGNEKCANN